MSEQLSGLENKIDNVVKDAPFQLPEKSRKSIVKYMPVISLVVGVLSLWAAYALWNAARVVDRLVDFSNSLSRAYGLSEPAASRLSLIVWVGIAFLAVEGVLYLLAYPKLKSESKAGWNLLFYGALLNLVHGVVLLFDGYYGGFGRLFGTLVSSAIGLYFLFQIRAYYKN